jgi:hypothetical protein
LPATVLVAVLTVAAAWGVGEAALLEEPELEPPPQAATSSAAEEASTIDPCRKTDRSIWLTPRVFLWSEYRGGLHRASGVAAGVAIARVSVLVVVLSPDGTAVIA